MGLDGVGLALATRRQRRAYTLRESLVNEARHPAADDFGPLSFFFEMGTPMSAKRKKKAPRRNPDQYQSVQRLSPAEVNLQREIQYIVSRATEHDARSVKLGPLAFFSSQTGDAWMLDLADGLALCLARDGVAQPVRIVETDKTMAVEWDRTFSINGDVFTTVEKKTGQTATVHGYPMQSILGAIANFEMQD